MGVSYDAWLQLNLPFPLPKELENFVPVVGDKHTAVSTKGDLHFYIRGNDSSVCFDMAYEISDIMKQAATSIEEIHGLRYWDGRSTFGFVDGTENPHEEERAFFGLVGNDDPVYRGGSYLCWFSLHECLMSGSALYRKMYDQDLFTYSYGWKR